MDDSSTSAEEAILRSTAVGHFPDPATNGARRTDMFMLPDSWAPAGSTPIGTINDLLAFGRTHLANGMSPSGKRVLSPESTARMQTVSHDMRTPNVPPIGLGWLLTPFGKTTVLSMSGASPGGVAVLALVPEHDLAFAAFGNDPRVIALHDQILLWLLRQHLNVEVPDLISETRPVGDLTPYAGTYRSNQLRVDVSVVDGQLEGESDLRTARRRAGADLYRVRRRLGRRAAAALCTHSREPLRAGRDATPGIQRLWARISRLIPRCQGWPCELSVSGWSHDSKGACRLRTYASAHRPCRRRLGHPATGSRRR